MACRPISNFAKWDAPWPRCQAWTRCTTSTSGRCRPSTWCCRRTWRFPVSTSGTTACSPCAHCCASATASSMSPCSRSPNPPACGCRPRRRDDCASCCASLSHGGYSSYRPRADNWRGRGRPVRLRANKPSYCSVAHAKPHRAAAAQSGVSCITSRGQWKHIYDRATSSSPFHTSSPQQSRDAAVITQDACSTVSDGSTATTGMIIEFTKMQGLGNDFVVIDATAQPFSLEPPQIARLADRHFGIGCDQVLLVEAPRSPGTDFRYRIFNADGGEVEQCGNGARCFVRYVRERGLTDKTEIVVEPAGGIIRPRIEADGRVSVDMGAPRFAPRDIPFLATGAAAHYDIDLPGGRVAIGAVSMG